MLAKNTLHSISDTDYFKLDCLSSSGVKALKKSPAHFQASKLLERKPTRAQMLGTMVHMVALEYDRFKRTYTYSDLDKRTREFKDLQNSHPQMTIVPSDEYFMAIEIAQALGANRTTREMLNNSLVEQSIVFEDQETGVMCKARLDAINHEKKIIIDLKTTEDARSFSFARSCASYDYHIQQAFYQMAAYKCGLGGYEFLFVAVEKEKPYGIGVYKLSKRDVEQAQMEIRMCLQKYKQCVDSSHWPCYTTEVVELELPAYKRDL